MSTVFTVELPGAYVDSVIEDASGGLLLINRGPEPDDENVAVDTLVTLDIAAALDTSLVLLASTQIYINDVLAFDGGTFTSGYDGPSAGYSNPAADVLRVIFDVGDSFFTSLEVVVVRVVSAADTGETLDTAYHFTIVDLTPPVLVGAEARALRRVRVTFDEAVFQIDEDDGNDALNPSNWTLTRWGDYLTPLVSVEVTSVEHVASNILDLITDIPLTPRGTYHATAANITDLFDNVVEDLSAEFTGWAPPVPAGRSFDLFKKLPLVNRAEDDTGDLFRFIACLQEVVDLQLFDIDSFLDILDPDLADEQYVDAMLEDLGNPFDFDLSLIDKRRLVQVLVPIYRLKGTAVGVKQVILFFLSLVIDIDAYNSDPDNLVLGESELGVGWQLGPSLSYQRFSFEVTVAQVLTDAQRKQLTDIVNFMKPGHTHFVRLNEPTIPDIVDHLELGLSSLGENWALH